MCDAMLEHANGSGTLMGRAAQVDTSGCESLAGAHNRDKPNEAAPTLTMTSSANDLRCKHVWQ
eukprot:1103444-Alexandrium_andersonii.AAC.1